MKTFWLLFFVSIFSLGFNFNCNTLKNHSGIKFKHLKLELAKKESLKSNKVIFIDAYTSWCGPCKKMAATSFQEEEVAEIYNEKFINLKIDVEKDPDGIEIAKTYKIKAFPTLLFIDGDGRLLKSVVGFQTADKLIAIAKSLE